MTTRQQHTTAAESLKLRLDVWAKSVDSATQHIQLGQTLQAQGVELLNTIQDVKADLNDIAKCIQQATATIEKGIKIERDAHREKIDLQQFKPK